MKKLYVVYWSGTGNTEAMAELVAEGAKAAGTEAEIVSVDQMDGAMLLHENAFALGCPSMGAEELEDSEMEPFISEIEGKLAGKHIALFGSYGWGDGEWMRNWCERMEKAGAEIVGGEGIIVCGEAEAETGLALKNAGEELSKYLL